MKALVAYAHPVEGSFCSAVRDRLTDSLVAAGHEVDLMDLYAEEFNTTLSAEEHALHHSGPENKPAIADHARRLSSAEALVFVYPTWWGGQPAILKGWFDRVWVEGVAYTLDEGASRIRPLLRNVRRLVVVTTHGSSKWVNALQGEPGKRVILRGLRSLCHPRARSRWIAMYGVDRSRESDRGRFLDRVGSVMTRL